jgi:hypothetical protein
VFCVLLGGPLCLSLSTCILAVAVGLCCPTLPLRSTNYDQKSTLTGPLWGSCRSLSTRTPSLHIGMDFLFHSEGEPCKLHVQHSCKRDYNTFQQENASILCRAVAPSRVCCAKAMLPSPGSPAAFWTCRS